MDTIRVVVADDHDLFRRGLTEVLEEEEDIDVVGQASDGREASEQAGVHLPDVVMMDLNMPFAGRHRGNGLHRSKVTGCQSVGSHRI